MGRTAVIVAALAAVLAAPAHAQTPTLLMPGVEYRRDVEFTPHGPVVVHVVTAPRPVGLYSLRPTLARDDVLARDRVTTMQKALAREGTSVAVNANVSGWTDGLVRRGVLDAQPDPGRSTVGIARDGSLRVDRVLFTGRWRGTGPGRPLLLNVPPSSNSTTMYTRAWGPTTPRADGTAEAVLAPFPGAAPNTDLIGTVVDLHQGGGTAIPPNGVVLVARDAQAGRLAAEAPVGTRVLVRLGLAPEWPDVPDAVGGGPVLVRNGRAIFNAGEDFSAAELLLRRPRTAVGQLADGRILLVVADGRPGESVGMTNFELALTMVRLGAVTASALDGGAASTLAFDGRVLNRPAGAGGEAAVAEALVLAYAGVYAPPPAYDVVSPNGDGVGDTQTLAYRLVRPARVTAALVAPDGSTRTLEAGARQPGVHPLTWDPSGAPEGRWTFRVTAVDDQGRSSTAERAFAVNATLGFLDVGPAAARVPGRVAVTFRLTRAARVTLTIEKRAGGVVRRLLAARPLAQGQQRVIWNGRTARGRVAVGGRYVVRAAASNGLGYVDLQKPFIVRRR